MNNMNTFFDDPLMLEMDEIETTPQELEDIIGEVFYEDNYQEHDELASMEATEDMAEDAAMIEDSLAMTSIYDIEEE